MRGTTRTVAVAVMSAAALLAAGCGGGDSSSGDGSTAAGKTGGEITIRGCNPENPLIPSNTTETCGGNVIDAFDIDHVQAGQTDGIGRRRLQRWQISTVSARW